jgi:hypothetical protein
MGMGSLLWRQINQQNVHAALYFIIDTQVDYKDFLRLSALVMMHHPVHVMFKKLRWSGLTIMLMVVLQ